MKRKDIEQLASKDDAVIQVCKVVEQGEDGITFLVDEGLSSPGYHLRKSMGMDIAQNMVRDEQIENSMYDIVACSFGKDKLASVGSDVLYRCFVRSFAEHRPLVLSPDMIWLIINQKLSQHLFDNAEKYRNMIVSHEGNMDIIVESKKDILMSKANWTKILDDFYKQIEKKTINGIASTMVADFTTTGANERICSIATLMHGVQSYFNYRVGHYYCGIPYITLKGTPTDWRQVVKKSQILKKFGLTTWYKWLTPILREFIRASEGKPHFDFWKNIVQTVHDEDFDIGSRCVTSDDLVDGWCVALFPFVGEENNKVHYDQCECDHKKSSEMTRVGFVYDQFLPDGSVVTTPMELWCGIVGVEEDRKTYSLTPKIGWFVRKSHEQEESLNRLNEANEHRGGIDLVIDEVPDLLKKVDSFSTLTLSFKGKIQIPEWLFDKTIKKLVLYGEIGEEYRSFLKSSFIKVYINENPYEEPEEDPEEEQDEYV